MSATTQGQDQEAFPVRLRRDISEAEKLSSKPEQLMQEALKLQRDRFFAPVIAIGGILFRGLCVIGHVGAAAPPLIGRDGKSRRNSL